MFVEVHKLKLVTPVANFNFFIIIYYIRRNLSNSTQDMNNFAVSANMAYGEVNLMAEAEYENPDAILRPSGQKTEAITNIMYEAIDSNPAAQTKEAVCVTHDST